MAISESTVSDNERTGKRVARGIRARPGGFHAVINVSGIATRKTFPRGTPLKEMQNWRLRMKLGMKQDEHIGERLIARMMPPLLEIPPLPDGCTAYVYAIQCDRYVKIGKAAKPLLRLADLQTAHPLELRLILALPCTSARATEAQLQRQFAPRRVRGEWFAATREMIEYLSSLR